MDQPNQTLKEQKAVYSAAIKEFFEEIERRFPKAGNRNVLFLGTSWTGFFVPEGCVGYIRLAGEEKVTMETKVFESPVHPDTLPSPLDLLLGCRSAVEFAIALSIRMHEAEAAAIQKRAQN